MLRYLNHTILLFGLLLGCWDPQTRLLSDLTSSPRQVSSSSNFQEMTVMVEVKGGQEVQEVMGVQKLIGVQEVRHVQQMKGVKEFQEIQEVKGVQDVQEVK